MNSYAKTIEAVNNFKSKILDDNIINKEYDRRMSKDDSSFRKYSYSENIYEIQEDQQLLEDESSDIDENFYDALSDYDKNLFTMIKDKQISINYSNDIKKKTLNEQAVEKVDLFRNKLILIVDARGLSLSINTRNERNENLIGTQSIERHTKEKSTFMKVQFNTNKFAITTNTDSTALSFLMNSFSVKHLNKELICSQIKESNKDRNLSVDEFSNQSNPINNSASDQFARSKIELECFFSLSFLQSNNRIIESKSVLNLQIGVIQFDIEQKFIEKLAAIVPSNFIKLFKQNKNNLLKDRKLKTGSFREGKTSDKRNIQTGVQNRLDLATEKNKTYSFFRERNKSKNESDKSSYFFDGASQKPEEDRANEFILQIKFKGVEGQFKIGNNSDIEVCLHDLISQIHFMNKNSHKINIKLCDFKMDVVKYAKIVVLPNSQNNENIEINMQYTYDEDSNTINTVYDAEIKKIQIDISGSNSKRLFSDICLASEMFDKLYHPKNIEDDIEVVSLNEKEIIKQNKFNLKLNSLTICMLSSCNTKAIEAKLKEINVELDSRESNSFKFGARCLELLILNFQAARVLTTHNIKCVKNVIACIKSLKLISISKPHNISFYGAYPKKEILIGELSCILCEEYLIFINTFISEQIARVNLLLDEFNLLIDNKRLKKKKLKNEELKEIKKADSFKLQYYDDTLNDRIKSIQEESKQTILKQFNSFNIPKGEILNNERNEKKKFIKDNAFIGCKFIEKTAQNRCNGLIDFMIEDSSSIQIKSFRLFWVHKLIVLNKNSEYSNDNSPNERLKEESKMTISFAQKYSDTSSLNSKDRNKIDSNEINFNEYVDFDSDENINDILLKHTHFGVELDEIFIGNQKWKAEKNLNRSSFDITHLKVEEPLEANSIISWKMLFNDGGYLLYRCSSLQPQYQEKKRKTLIINWLRIINRIRVVIISICFFSLEYFLFLSNMRKFLLMMEQI